MLYFDNDEERNARVERILEELTRRPAPSKPIKVQAVTTGLINAWTIIRSATGLYPTSVLHYFSIKEASCMQDRLKVLALSPMEK